MPIAFTKVKLPYGWLGNMAPYPVKHGGKRWRTTEAQFQALRFDPARHRKIIEAIRANKSPMSAKMIAKRHKEQMVVVPRSRKDVANLEMVLRLKLRHHPELKQQLLDTGDETIIEDCSRRLGGSGMFWGAAWQDGQWVGKNMLGKAWMRLRERLRGRRRQKASKNGIAIEDVQTLKRLIDRIGFDAARRLVDILG